MVKENIEVKLTNQSFQEAGGKESFPNLELGGIVAAEAIGFDGGKDNAMDAANKELIRIAKKKEV